MLRTIRRITLGLLIGIAASRAAAENIVSGDLQIQGAGLRVVTVSAATGIDIPAAIQTEFGGKQNDEAPVVEGLVAVGDLTGPGIDTPIRLETAPGHKFQIPALSRKGIYFLQNIRLVKDGEFLQPATPSVATITVDNLLQTEVKVRQLTPDELRARGISIDDRNFEVYEYTFSFFVDGKIVEIPFPVIIDKRTHEVREVVQEEEYKLPPINNVTPPRWTPPAVAPFELGPGADFPSEQQPDREKGSTRPSIPAALVIPNSLAVLHQFFAVTLMVTNGAPAGSSVQLDSVSALIKTPAELRTVKSLPPVAFNQAVPIVDATTGATFLIAKAQGSAEWTVEGLKPGTHTLEVTVHATYKSPGQADFPLKGTVRATVVVHDPRFNINFSHPDTVRKGIDYSTYSFITNMSGSPQTIHVTNTLQACSVNPTANVCRLDETPEFVDLTIPAGEMRMVEYKLRPNLTGHVFATAGSISDDNITASVQLFMGVSESGIPLSPVTLVMPYYARYVSQDLISPNLQLLGLGYSLATAPLTQALAKHPRVIKTDVFERAVDIARAGQRIFLGEDSRDAMAHMSLDLLGNTLDLREWDDLRRQEKSGRIAGASVARELEKGADDVNAFVTRFASTTAHRAGYTLAVMQGAAELSVKALPSGAMMSVPNEATDGWVRNVPYGDLSRFKNGQIAMVGRWSSALELRVTPTTNGSISLDVIYPAAADGSLLRAHADFNGTAGKTYTLSLDRGADHLNVLDDIGGSVAVASIVSVQPEPVRLVGARQDMHLDDEGHKVSVLFSRPVKIADGDDWLKKFHAQVLLNKDGVNYTGNRPMSAAALQGDSRVVNVTFDHALSQNASYSLSVDAVIDPLTNVSVAFPTALTPVIDNNKPGGIIYGHVFKGDNTPIPNAEVVLRPEGAPQFDLSAADGSFLFEFVPRDIDNNIAGTYLLQAITVEGKDTKLQGAVRLPGRVHFVNLVFLGRGSAQGYVRYDNGEVVKGARVVVGSTMFDQFREGTTDDNGFYSIEDLPVGPLTFSATDKDGNITYGASEIKTPGQVLVKDLSIYRRPFPGVATVRGIVKRSDTGAAVPGAHVGVYSQGYGLMDGFTDSAGQFEFTKVPAGFITVLASEWSISLQSVAIDFDIAADETRDLTLTLNVVPNQPLVQIEGDVVREDPLHPGDPAFYQKVAGALVKIDNGQAVTADANGHYALQPVPVSFSGHTIKAYDPATKRTADAVVPTLDPTKINFVPVFISTASGYGHGSIRVRVYSAAGFPITGLRVLVPGFPPTVLPETGSGIYTLSGVPVGATMTIWAISTGGTYGDQFALGSAKVEFDGHVAALNLRFGGQGIVRVKLVADIDVIGDVKISYPVWDEEEQGFGLRERTVSSAKNGVADFAVFDKVPAILGYSVASTHPVYGFAGSSGKLGFDGDVQSITLQLNKLSTVRGFVYAIDGQTPVAGAIVRIEDGRQNQGTYATLPDGSFVFFNEPAGTNFRVVAEITQDGVYRTGYANGFTPQLGGPVNNVRVLMRTQGSVDGKIVYAGFKRYDPLNPANNIVDDTPNDLSDNAPVPLARYQLREFDFPGRAFGTSLDPLIADIQGQFTINNLFTGPIRVDASDPNNQENRGSTTDTLSQEGERRRIYIPIGVIGFGSATILITDPNNLGAAVYNAEVSIYRGNSVFDLTTTDGNGIAHFDQLPAGTYSATAFSKALGRSGGTIASFTITANADTFVRIQLVFSGKVTGRLTDPEKGSIGVPGAPVTLTAFNYSTRTSTEVSGDFLFEGVREGNFALDAKDTLSNRRAHATRTLSQADPEPHVDMELERTQTLYVSVYLPDDAGGNSNILAPLVNLDVVQRNNEFMRSLQGNAFQMPQLFRDWPYSGIVREVGGQQREIRFSGSFPNGDSDHPIKLVFPAYGNVEVRVTQAGVPASNARVTVSGGGRSVTIYTDAGGVALANGIGLGQVYVQAVTVDGAFSGSASSTLTSQTTPVVVPITLGAFAGVTGYVEAELGGPSANTRVIATFGRNLEIFTDSTGHYTFQGIPTNTTVNLTYMGPDDVTPGAHQSYQVKLSDAQKLVTLADVKLDATPPTLLNFFPADGAQNVSPDSSLRFTFSEAIGSQYINNTYFQLVPADSSQQLNCSFVSSPNPDGTFSVTMKPPATPPGEKFPLKSNTLYRIIVSGDIHDLTGNKMPATRGGSFITSDYAEPHVTKTTPNVLQPLQAATTLVFTFNEPIDASGAAFHFYKLSAPGPTGTIVAEKPGRTFVDPGTGLTLNFAPDDPIEQQSFYRVVFSGVRDLQGNLAPEQTFHFFSYDLNKPVVNFISPVPDTFPLISGVQYTLKLNLTNTDGTPATDVSRVDYFRVDGTAQTFLYTTTASPFSYTFVAPDVPSSGGTLTYRAIATDQSSNISEPASITWQVQPNKPPQSVTLTLTPASAYASNRVNTAVAFTDEGTFTTVQVDAAGTQSSGSSWTDSRVKNVTRTTVDAPWPATSFDFDLPATLQEGSTVTFTSTVTDVRGQKGTATAPLSVLTDAIKPTISLTLPAAETRYTIGSKYQVEALVGDNESGVRDVTFAFDNQTIKVLRTNTAKVTPGAQPHTWKYVSGQITVPAKNIDTRIPIVVTVTDYHGNATVSTVEVIYVGVNDPAFPKGAWLCPIDHGTFPASTNLPVTLQVRATDDIAVTGVKFLIPGVATPVAATRVAATGFGSDTYQATVTLATPAPDTLYTLSAIISDADPLHDVELTTSLDFVPVDITIDERTQAVVASDVATFQNKSIVVKGSTAHFVPHVPLTLKNLIVLNGAKVETLASTTGIEQKLDLTVSDHLYVDCQSSIDVSNRGYLGGWGVNADGSNTKNNDARGLTLGNSPTNGPTTGASASYAGLGGERSGGKTNATYGSVTAPFDLGTGGAGNTTCCTAGAQGGGAVRLTAGAQPEDLGLFSIAGAINANGGSGSGIAEAGSGGSINISSKQFIVGPNGRITANGGDDDAVDQASRGAGGGRIAIAASDRFAVETMGTHVQARGGRNNTSTETASFLDGGAGTIFTKLPGETTGGLFISSLDERAPSSAHLTRPTPLAAITVDRLELGARALVRADDTLTIGTTTNDRSAATIAASAVLVLPNDQPVITVTPAQPAGSTLTQGFTLNTAYSATSPAGIGSVTTIWTPVTPNRVDTYATWPATASQASFALAIPNNSPSSATLTVTATDRAGRTGSSAPLAYTIVANQPPIIDKFLVVPTSLYPGKSVAITVSAHDEVAVTKLTLTSVIGNGTPAIQTKTPNTAVVTDTVFTPIAVPITTPGDTPMTLTLSAEDAYPGNTPRTQTVPVTILKDTIPPALNVTAPVANTLYNEGSGNTIPIRFTASDAEVAIKQAFYQIDGGAQVALTAGANNTYSADVPIPPVDGTDNVTKHIVITVLDYENNPSTSDIAILIKPLNDVNAPVITLACPSPGALFPAGYGAKLRVFALGNNTGNAANGIQSLQFFINGSTTPINAAPVSGLTNYYEATFSIPSDATAGTAFSVRGVVTNVAGLSNEIATSFSVVAGTKITADTTIAANNAQFDNTTLIIQSGTTTILGAHTFDALVVLDGAKVTHPQNDKLTITTANALFVSCTGSIDASGRGYGVNTSYPGATLPGFATGGSHIGYGGLNSAPLGSTYGSVYQPAEAGAGGNRSAAGGGIISITSGSLVADGAIRANGSNVGPADDGSAGGSILIRTGAAAGAGVIEANGGSWGRSGGGGAVAIEYTSGTLPAVSAWTGGTAGATGSVFGGAGSVWLKGPNATYGTLVINDNNHSGSQVTELPSLGSGIAQSGSSGATLVTDRASNIPAYFLAHWVEIRTSAGAFKGLYRISAINAKTATLAANGGDTPNVLTGDQWRGVYRFDAVTIAGIESLISIDPILIGANRVQTVYGTTVANQFITYAQPITGDDISIVNRVALSQIKARTLSVESGAFLTSGAQSLTIDASSSVNVKSGATIDVTGRGFALNTTYAGATTPGTSTAGSHIGYGGLSSTPLASTFGSIYQPLEAGGGGRGAGAGGGVITITTASLTNDGSIRANGQSSACCEGGAGGSIWIRTQAFAGAGPLEANGGDQQRTGGGGAVSIEYTSGTPSPTAWAGGAANATGSTIGGAGTILFKGPSSTFGSLLINNNGHGANAQATELPGFGAGTAQSGSSGATLVTNRAANIPAYFAGHWLTVRDSAGAIKGKWRIAAINSKTVTLTPNGNETISIQPGDLYRGTYRLDSLELRSAKLRTEDFLDVASAPVLDAASSIIGNNISGPALNASLITLGSNATGSSVIGTAGAVSDPDTPITLIATNTVSNNSYTSTANADGSFTVPVQGNAGDTITIKAKDGNVYPLESNVITVGPLTVSTPTASQIDRSTWTTDTNFRARVLANDATRLLVSSNTGSGSDKLVILSITDPVHPSLVRTVTLGNGAISDIAIVNNYAYITANDFITLDLGSTTSVPFIHVDRGNTETSLVVSNGYAFVTTPHFNKGMLRIYDVSTPSNPRWMRDQETIIGVDFTGIAAYGSNYLVAFSPNKTGSPAVGHDVVVFDRTDINSFSKVGDIDIPNFDANNGRVIGNKVYVTSLSSPDVWVVDLANPAAAVTLGKVTVGGNSSGVSSIKNDLFVAAGAAGLVDVDVTNPAAPAVAGAFTTTGTAYDVALQMPYAYVANDSGLAVVPISTPPQVEPSRISMSLPGAMVAITGGARAVTGSGALTVAATDVATNVTSAAQPVASDGTFSINLAANAGDAITVEATDASGRKSGPVPIGIVPYGAAVSFVPIPAAAGANFHPRTMAVEGNTLIVGGWQDSNTTKVAIFDVTDPTAPVYKRAVSFTPKEISSFGAINDVNLRNGWALVNGEDLAVFDANSSVTSVVGVTDSGAGNNEQFGVVVGGYLFNTTRHFEKGRIRIYDVSDPASTRVVRDHETYTSSGVTFLGITAYGSSRLVAFSPDRPNGVGHDVVIFDATDINNFRKLADVDIAGASFNAFRGKVLGTTLYVAGTNGGVAVVDIADPTNPVLQTILPASEAYGVDVAGRVGAIADGSAGVTFLDTTNPNAPVVTGTMAVGGSAWSVLFNRGHLYIANEQGIVVVQNLATAPLVAPSLVSITPASGTTATVAGAAGAIGGVKPLTVEVKNARSGASVSGQSVAADGSFSILLSASVGDPITVEATDPAGRKSGPVAVGAVPFGSAVTQTIITSPAAETFFKARTLSTDGTNLIVGGYGDGNSTKVFLYDVSNPATPVLRKSYALGNGAVNDVLIQNGWAYVANADLEVLDLSNLNAAPLLLSSSNDETALLASGGYLFSATPDFTKGTIRIRDISVPGSPRNLPDQATVTGVDFTGLAALGDNYIAAFTPNRTANQTVGHDLVILDKSNVFKFVIVADIDIGGAAFNAFRGKVVGNTLYLAGKSGGLAIVDVSNPANPVVKKIMTTAGTPFGAAGSGNLVAIADGGAGVTFLDGSNPADPQIIGTQPVGGTSWSVAFNRGNAYVANEQGVAVIRNVGTAPIVTSSLVTISGDGLGHATVTGAAGAVTGTGTLQVEVKNTRGGATVSNAAVAGNGSFSVTLDALPGDPMTVEATDAAGRKSGAVYVGTVPFGSSTGTIIVSTAQTEANFHPRTIATDGRWAVVSGYNDGGTTKVAVFDVSDPANPVFQRAVSPASGRVDAVGISNGQAVIAAMDFGLLDLGNPASTPLMVIPVNYNNDENDLVTTNSGLVFTTSPHFTKGTIRVYDITNPTAPFAVRDEFTVTGVDYTGLAAFGEEYLIGTGPNHDVVVIDRRDPDAIGVVKDFDVPGFNGFRGKVSGTTFYLAGTTGGVAVVDLSDPKNPVVKTIIQTAGDAYGVDISGATLAVADGTAGVTFFDITDPFNPIRLGTQPTGGWVFSVVFNRGQLYAVNDQGLVVIRNVIASPIVDRSLVAVANDGSGNVTVSGAAGAVTGIAPLTFAVKNIATSTTTSSAAVAANGSFSAALAAVAGNALSLLTADAAQRGGSLSIGQVPFGTVTSNRASSVQAANDTAFRARRIAVDGTLAALATGSYTGYASGTIPASRRVVAFDLSNGNVRSYPVGTSGQIYDVAVQNGYAFVASDDFASINIADPAATPFVAPDAGNVETSVTLAGNYAYTTTPHFNKGRIRLYDITSPAHPVWFREQEMLADTAFVKVARISANMLAAVTTNDGHDLALIDITNPSALVRLCDFDINGANFHGFDVAGDGTTVYVAGGDAGVAIVDITTPSNPVLKAIVNTPGNSRSVAISGTNEIAVADGAGGITFVDTTDRSNPVIKGTQFVPGNSTGVAVTGKSVYTASERYFNVISRP